MPVEKRSRDDENNNAWCLTFHQTSALRTLIDVVATIIGRVNIRVVNAATFSGISVESIDSKRVCLVAAKLACDVSSLPVSKDCDEDENSECFCVDTTTLSTCIKSITSNYSLELARRKGSDEVELRAFEILCNCYSSTFRLPTLAHDHDKVKLQDMDIDYVVEFDMQTLRSIVRNCINLKGENIRIMMEEDRENTSPVKKTRLTLRSEGNAEQTHVFHNVTSNETDDDGKAVSIRTMETVDGSDFRNMKVWYDETFSSAYLNMFLKNMEKNSITMRLADKKPLVLSYALCSDKSSNICFVLAAKATED
jgi:hypothetical protein